MISGYGKASKLYLLLVFTIFFLPNPRLASQSTGKCQVAGQIQDQETGLPLEAVNVSVNEKNIGTTTDKNGKFVLNLLPDEYVLIFAYIGYTTVKQPIVIKPGEQERTINIELKTKILPLPGVSITEQSGETEGSIYTIDQRPLHDMASPLPDILLSLKTLPGVSSQNDQSTLYNVRGGNFDENLIYINGVEIYQPQMVRKGIAENPSLVNPLMLESINFRTGVFPVSYGDKLSSVLDLKYRKIFERTFIGAGDISAIGLNVMTGIRPVRNTWLQFAYRRIRYGYLLNAHEVNGKYTPLFEDFQGQLFFQPDPKISVTLFGLKASSRFYLMPEASPFVTLNNNNLGNARYQNIFHLSFGGSEAFDYNTGLFSAQIEYNTKLGISLNWINSFFSQKEEEKSGTTTSLEERLSNDYVTKAIRHEDVNSFFEGRFYASHPNLQWLISTKLLINIGVEFKYFDIVDSLYSSEFEETDSNFVFIDRNKNYNSGYKKRQGSLLGRYVQVNYQLTKNLALQAGLRWAKSSLNHEQLFLPRIQALYRFSQNSEITLAAGQYAQPPIHKEFQFRDGKDSGLLSQKATQFTLGFQRLLKEDLSFKIEVYYKKYNDLISYDLNDVQIQYSGENDSHGYAYGLDAFLHGSIIPDTENWISYSYLVARENIFGNAEGYVPRSSDRRHQISIYNEDKMEKLPWSKLFVRVVFGTGFPFTYNRWIYNESSGSYELVQGKRNQGRLPFYGRVDLGFSQEFAVGDHVRLKLREELLNLWNRRNTLGYDLAFNELVVHHLSGRIVNFGLRVEF